MAVLNTIPTPREILDRRNQGAAQLSFPEDIESNPHRTVLLFNKYSVPRAVATPTAATPFGGILDTATTFQSTVGITLPVPIKIFEPYNIKYEINDLGIVGAGIVEASRGVMTGDITSTILGGMITAGAGVASAIGQVTGVGQLLSALGPGLRAATGVNINPYTTALFKNVEMRVFQLAFKLSPQSVRETERLEQIIDAIRVRIHPEPYFSNLTNILLRTPELVTFKILNSLDGSRLDTSFPTAPCFVVNFTVDRTGADYPTFYAETGAPVVYFMQIVLLEVLPLLRRDNKLQINNPLELIGRE